MQWSPCLSLGRLADEAAERLYRRVGSRTVWLIGLGGAGVGVLTAGVTAFIAGRYFALSPSQTVSTAIIFTGADLVFCVIGVVRSSEQVRAMRTWDRDHAGATDPLTAWRALVHHTKITLRCAGPMIAITPLQAIYIVVRFHMPRWGVAPLTVGAALALSAAVVLIMFAAELANRPARAEVAKRLPPSFEPEESRVGLGLKLLAPLPVITLFASMLVGAYANGSPNGLVRFTLTLATGSITAVLATVIFAVIHRSLLRPIDDLAKATRRVARGDFAVHLPVVSTDEIGTLTHQFNQMVAGLAKSERVRQHFGTYVDPDVAAHIIDTDASFGGEEVEVTVMFLDVRGFTALAETTPAPKVVGMLNGLFSVVVPIVHHHGGRIDKYVGDGLIAVFGAPRPINHQADRAVAAALAIDSAVHARAGLGVGIGLNSGKVLVGNVGAPGRYEFAVIGDAVNVAARVEAQTRTVPDSTKPDTILLAQDTFTRLTLFDTPIAFVNRGAHPMKGKREPIYLYTPAPGARIPAPLRGRHDEKE